MLYTQTVDNITLAVLKGVMAEKSLDNFALLGGTALALQIGDIAPKKLDAISGRGSKKDFYDVYFLLQHCTLEEMFELYMEKYPHQTTFHLLRSLAYFEDAEKDPDPVVFDASITWPVVKSKITEVIRNFG